MDAKLEAIRVELDEKLKLMRDESKARIEREEKIFGMMKHCSTQEGFVERTLTAEEDMAKGNMAQMTGGIRKGEKKQHRGVKDVEADE